MKHIVKTTQYWIFKPIFEGSQYSFVRSQVMNMKPAWFMGYENSMGLVSRVGGNLKPENVDKLEKEWQAYVYTDESFISPVLSDSERKKVNKEFAEARRKAETP